MFVREGGGRGGGERGGGGRELCNDRIGAREKVEETSNSDSNFLVIFVHK